MSVLVIRNDDGCEEVYNRTTVFCYTKMPMERLWEYIKGLELLSEDRQALFFKIDVDIFSAPDSLLPDLKDWFILSIVLKAHIRPFSFGILVKLFYEEFPAKMMVDFSSTNLFICSGSLENEGKSLSANESTAHRRLAAHHMKSMKNVIAASENFKQNAKSAEEAPALLVDMARRYEMPGGHWILFFNKMDPSRREESFYTALDAAFESWGPTLSRFNAKLSTENFIICFGNKSTRAAIDPMLLESSNNNKSEEDDPEPLELLHMIDRLYESNATLFGFMGIKYKPDIVSACCIQRDNFIRPTVYQANYGFYNSNFQPCHSVRKPKSASSRRRPPTPSNGK